MKLLICEFSFCFIYRRLNKILYINHHVSRCMEISVTLHVAIVTMERTQLTMTSFSITMKFKKDFVIIFDRYHGSIDAKICSEINLASLSFINVL